MPVRGVSFSVVADAAWAPGLDTREAWLRWAEAPHGLPGGGEPPLSFMPAMQRRRVAMPGRMALQVAHDCLEGRTGVPAVFASRHGEVKRAVEQIGELLRGEPLSPTAFGLAVHNAPAGLFSIARGDRANQLALSAGADTVETAVLEACGLLADGAPEVLLVVYDAPLPTLLAQFEDVSEQQFAWAWLIQPAGANAYRLEWQEAAGAAPSTSPAGLEVLRFHLGAGERLVRQGARLAWCWSRHG
jgi:hypothetical protein